MAVYLNVRSILLIPLTISSYLPQCKKLLSSRSTTGISVMGTFLLALSAQSQLVTMYYLFVCPPSKRYGSVIPNPPFIQDYINLSQLLAQWVCSLLLLALVLVIELRPKGPSNDNSTSASRSSVKKARILIALLVGHAGLCLFWAWFADVPTDDWLDLSFVIIMSINNDILNYFITAAIVAAFVLQIHETTGFQPETALDATTLLLQGATFLALATSWPIRFTMPKNLSYSSELWYLDEWYPNVGWACVNNAIIALGQYLVLHVANTAEVSEGQLGGETRPLLD